MFWYFQLGKQKIKNRKRKPKTKIEAKSAAFHTRYVRFPCTNIKNVLSTWNTRIRASSPDVKSLPYLAKQEIILMLWAQQDGPYVSTRAVVNSGRWGPQAGRRPVPRLGGSLPILNAYSLSLLRFLQRGSSLYPLPLRALDSATSLSRCAFCIPSVRRFPASYFSEKRASVSMYCTPPPLPQDVS